MNGPLLHVWDCSIGMYMTVELTRTSTIGLPHIIRDDTACDLKCSLIILNTYDIGIMFCLVILLHKFYAHKTMPRYVLTILLYRWKFSRSPIFAHGQSSKFSDGLIFVNVCDIYTV
jgi:hypothetical protein